MTEGSPRHGTCHRDTRETSIDLRLQLTPGAGSFEVPNGFLGHMLEALATHAGWTLDVRATGDTHVDLHHTVEDVGICLGEALREALGDRRGIVRFAHAYVPLDEALARAVIDLSGRGYFDWAAPSDLTQAWVTREFPLTLVADFFQAVADRSRTTLHVAIVQGRNPHHAAEAAFKAVAVALRQAVALGRGDLEVPSTKGSLDV